MSGKVLIIESDLYEIGILTKVFSGIYDIQFVPKVEEAVKECQKINPEVIVFNIKNPDKKEVIELNEVIDRMNYRIPIITIVSENSIETERFLRMQKVFFYLIKPYDFRVLEDAVNCAIRFTRERSLKTQILAIKMKQ